MESGGEKMPVWTYIWLAVLIVSILVEAGTMGLVSIWFAAGALAAWVLAMLGVGELVQCAVFVAVSALLLIFTRPLVKKYLTPKIQPTNVDAVIGREGVVDPDDRHVGRHGAGKTRRSDMVGQNG